MQNNNELPTNESGKSNYNEAAGSGVLSSMVFIVIVMVLMALASKFMG